MLLGNHLTRLDYKFFFLSWIGHPLYTFTSEECKNIKLTPETEKYFRNFPDVTFEQKCWYQSKKREQGDKMQQEFPSTSEEAFSKPLEGAYYAKQMRKVLNDGRICEVDWNPEFPVYTYCDIGHSDYTVNIYVQFIGRYVHIFDMYVGDSANENNDMADMINDMRSKPYRYAVHVAPHDFAVYEWGAGATRKEQALNKYGIHFEIAPKEVSLLDGIDMVKNILGSVVICKVKCMRLVSGLRKYRRRRLPDGSFSSKPNHDGSDFADPVRYMAVTSYLVNSGDVVDMDCIESGACL